MKIANITINAVDSAGKTNNMKNVIKLLLIYTLLFNSIRSAHAYSVQTQQSGGRKTNQENTSTDNELVNKKKVKVIFGKGGSAGGEPGGQEIMGTAKALYHFLVLNQNYFPEINLDKLRNFLKIDSKDPNEVPFEVEIERNIIVDGSEKCMRSDPDLLKVFHDPTCEEKMTPQEFVAMVFHEVLVLMRIEKNNQYSVSSRLNDQMKLTNIHLNLSKNQIYPKDSNDKSVIYWIESKTDDEKYLNFFFCEDRNLIQTCKRLGNRSYSVSEIKSQIDVIEKELAEKSKELKKLQDLYHEKNKINNNITKIYIGIVLIIALFAALFSVAALSSAFLAIIVGLFAGSVGRALLDDITGLNSTGSKINTIRTEIEEIPGLKGYKLLANPKPNIEDIKHNSELLHQFLINIDENKPFSVLP